MSDIFKFYFRNLGDKVFVYDFCFKQSDNLYATVIVYNNILKITPSKKITIKADIEKEATGVLLCCVQRFLIRCYYNFDDTDFKLNIL